NKTERRFFIIEKRDRHTLLPIIEREVEISTTIYSNQWRAYSSLNDHGFIHQTVNYSENFVDPNTGTHTQTIESLWKLI
ncbi:DDE Tnp IS1595 domain-containing protein, partial [Aphis craccivora]